MDSSDAIQVLILIALIGLSAYFSSSETALLTVSKIRIRNLIEDGNPQAVILGKVIEDQGKMLMDLWLEFEAYETPEARFAHVMDNFQPLLLNHENDGKDWPRHNVRISQPLKRNEKTATGSEEIWSYMEEILEQSIRDGKIIDDREEKQE